MKISRPTLKDVALRSGYALPTVKKVMSGNPHVRDRTREAVMRAAEELQYSRNRVASALSRNRTFKIALVYTITTDALYFPEIEEGFLRYAQEMRDFGLSVEFCTQAKSGSTSQRDILQELLNRDDIDGVIIEPYNKDQLNDIINQLTAAGKPVVTFTADAPDSRRLCHVGCDGYQAGRIAAQILANYIGKRGKVYVLASRSGHSQTRSRVQGFLDRINEHDPNITVEVLTPPKAQFCDTVRELVLRGDMNGLFCISARTTLVGKVFREMNTKNIPVVGFDLSEELKTLMKADYVQVVIDQRPAEISYCAAKLLFQYLAEGTLPPKKTVMQTYILTSECLESSGQ